MSLEYITMVSFLKNNFFLLSVFGSTIIALNSGGGGEVKA